MSAHSEQERDEVKRILDQQASDPKRRLIPLRFPGEPNWFGKVNP